MRGRWRPRRSRGRPWFETLCLLRPAIPLFSVCVTTWWGFFRFLNGMLRTAMFSEPFSVNYYKK